MCLGSVVSLLPFNSKVVRFFKKPIPERGHKKFFYGSALFFVLLPGNLADRIKPYTFWTSSYIRVFIFIVAIRPRYIFKLNPLHIMKSQNVRHSTHPP